MPRTKVIRLPKLMLAAKVRQTIEMLDGIVGSEDEVVRIDADELEFAEPLSLCLLAAQLNRLHNQGQTAAVERVRPEVADRLRRMNVLGEWLEEKTRGRYKAHSMNTLQVCWVSSQDDADVVRNSISLLGQHGETYELRCPVIVAVKPRFIRNAIYRKKDQGIHRSCDAGIWASGN